MYDEGVIKFSAEHRREPLPARVYGELCCRLVAWREIMALTQLVGQDPARYGGAGYGNISGRIGPPSSPRGRRAMLITGSQTGGQPALSLSDFCLVEAYDYRQNRVWSAGEALPSSETMTHGSIYDLSPHIRFVVHAHSPVIWRAASALGVPETRADVAYGTPEMALEVQRLYRETAVAETKLFAMGGHEDGVVAFGHRLEEAGQTMVATLARAYELRCGAAL